MRTAIKSSKWEESKHPRADNGQFGSGGAGASSGASDEKKPASGGSDKPTRQRLREMAQKRREKKQRRKELKAKVVAKLKAFMSGKLVTSVKSRAIAAKELAGRLGSKTWNKLGPKTQKAMKGCWIASKVVGKGLGWGYKGFEHAAETPYHMAQKAALAVAKEQGLKLKQVNKVAKVMAVGDGILRWTANIPVLSVAVRK